QLATQLYKIHTIDYADQDLAFLPAREKKYATIFEERPDHLDHTLDEGRIRHILRSTWPIPQQNSPVLLHADFWPGNLLWREGHLVAIVDWEDAALGDPPADLANSRLEILWAFGIDAMDHFTQQYRSMSTIDFSNLPYWDLCVALRPISKIAEWAADTSAE